MTAYFVAAALMIAGTFVHRAGRRVAVGWGRGLP
jgi:hypothetical protein